MILHNYIIYFVDVFFEDYILDFAFGINIIFIPYYFNYKQLLFYIVPDYFLFHNSNHMQRTEFSVD